MHRMWQDAQDAKAGDRKCDRKGDSLIITAEEV